MVIINYLEKFNQNFVIDKDYKVLLPFAGEQTNTNLLNPQVNQTVAHEASGAKKGRGGHNKEIIMLEQCAF